MGFDGETFRLSAELEAHIEATARFLDQQRDSLSGVTTSTQRQLAIGVPFAPSSQRALMELAQSLERFGMAAGHIAHEIRKSCDALEERH